VAPSPTVVVVLPTPPLRDITATRWWPPTTGVRARAMSSRRRRSAADSPGRIAPPVALKIILRQPPDGAVLRSRSRVSALRLSEVGGAVGGRCGTS